MKRNKSLDPIITFDEWSKQALQYTKPILQIRLILCNANLQGQMIEDVIHYKSMPIAIIHSEVSCNKNLTFTLRKDYIPMKITYDDLFKYIRQNRKSFFIYPIWRPSFGSVRGVVISEGCRYVLKLSKGDSVTIGGDIKSDSCSRKT